MMVRSHVFVPFTNESVPLLFGEAKGKEEGDEI
jgi:hypothetical protein